MSKKQAWALVGIYLVIIVGCWAITAILGLIVSWIGPSGFMAETVGAALLLLAVIVGLISLAVTMVLFLGYIIEIGQPGDYIFGELIKAGKIVAYKDVETGGIFKILEHDEFHWSCDYPYDGCELYDPLYAYVTHVRVSPITGNPKVREIICSVKIEPPTDIAGLNQLKSVLGNNFPYSEALVASLLYDFCEEHSRQLGELFNPFRPEQQEKFKEMIKPWLAPKLEPLALRLADASFSFPG